MIRTKLGLLGLCAIVLGIMAMSASAAQATFSWLVLDKNGENLSALKAELVGKVDTQHLTLLTELVGLKVAISCTGFTLKNVFIEGAGKVAEGGKMIFTGCAAYKEVALGENLGCTVKSPGAAAGTLESNELKGELVLHTTVGGTKEVLTKIEPKIAGGDFATFRNEGCALTEVNPLRGVFYLKDCEPPATTHRVRHLVETEKTLTALYFGAHVATKLERTKIDGSAWVELGPGINVNHVGLSWAPMDV